MHALLQYAQQRQHYDNYGHHSMALDYSPRRGALDSEGEESDEYDYETLVSPSSVPIVSEVPWSHQRSVLLLLAYRYMRVYSYMREQTVTQAGVSQANGIYKRVRMLDG
jgi:hypothetical protein